MERREPTPILAQQVERAERAGPGFLVYCPRHSGVAPAVYTLAVPGGAIATGWCRTYADRRDRVDVVSFQAHWNASRAGAGKGTQSLTYAVPRWLRPPGTPVPTLIAQAGPSPP